MVSKIGNKDNINFVSIILICSCHLPFKKPVLHLMDHASTSKNLYCIAKRFWMIFAKWLRLFSSALYTKHSFFKCYLIPEILAAVKGLQIRCKVVFRLSGYCTCENVMAKPSHQVRKENTWEHADLPGFFLLLKNKQLALQYVHTLDQEMYPLLKR